VKVSKFQFVALVLISVLICGIIIVIFDISRMKAELDRLYWIAENTHSGMVQTLIERTESLLYQRQTILMGLAGLTALIIVSSILSLQSVEGKNESFTKFPLFYTYITTPKTFKFKPELTALEVCNRLALSEGQKENEMRKRRGEK